MRSFPMVCQMQCSQYSAAIQWHSFLGSIMLHIGLPNIERGIQKKLMIYFTQHLHCNIVLLQDNVVAEYFIYQSEPQICFIWRHSSCRNTMQGQWNLRGWSARKAVLHSHHELQDRARGKCVPFVDIKQLRPQRRWDFATVHWPWFCAANAPIA